MSDVDKEWNKLVSAHETAVSDYGVACAEVSTASHVVVEANQRLNRATSMVGVKKYEVERALGALLKHAAATGRA